MTQGCLAQIGDEPTDSRSTEHDLPFAAATARPGKGAAVEGMAAIDEDDVLLARIAENDEAAFRRLLERHIDRAFGLALRILNNATDAEDIVQDTLLKIWMHRGRWEPGRAKFSTWLYRVVTNRCIDLHRRPRNDHIEEIPEVADQAPSAIIALQRHEMIDLLEKAMMQLPDQQRVAIILSYHENLTNAEIAEVMQTTVSAAESLLKRGRQRLRELLRPTEGEILASFTND